MNTKARRKAPSGILFATSRPISHYSLLPTRTSLRDFRATGTVLVLPTQLARKAEALYLAERTSEALEAFNEAIPIAERFELRDFRTGLHRLRAVFLAAIGADKAQIEASFSEAIRIAREQKSVSLQKRAEATYAEYRRQQASASGGRGFRLSL